MTTLLAFGYDALLWLAQPLLRRKLRRRGGAEPGYLHAVDERFGHYAVARPEGDGPLVWVHAVSLGETRAAAILIDALRAQWPGLRLVLTHGTATGRAEGQKLLRAGDVQVWQPWDTRRAVRRFLAHFRPDVGVLMETEIWPNLIGQSAARGVPLVLANARLSAKSLRGAERAGWLMRPAYRALVVAYAQTEADATRLRAIGVRQVSVLGNLKFDATPDAPQLAQAARWRVALAGRRIVMLASSREGEEADFLKQIKPLTLANKAQTAIENETSVIARRANNQTSLSPSPAGGGLGWGPTTVDLSKVVSPHPSLPPAGEGVGSPSEPIRPLWLIVPRHPQRFDEVARLAADTGWRVARRSMWGDAPPPEALQADVWVGDSLGEMALYYGLADVALLGGSFAPLGGQNLIEAAACGCPVVMGPHTFNFAQAAEQAVDAGAAQRVQDMAEGVAAAQALLADVHAHAAMRDAATGFAAAHRGAAVRMAQALAGLLPTRAGA
ncbi:MAG: 3-deoxy-D-manno-octulosonic acid transferase [Pseudomonadota bacterium]|nr:3-deoxy-D-manno-octulosonic acid transferase [Pseudomonadota bacterium]